MPAKLVKIYFVMFPDLGFIIKVVCKGLKAAKEEFKDPSDDMKKLIEYFDAVESVKHNSDGFAVAMVIEEKNLSKEHVPAVMLSSKEVLLVPNMCFFRH